MREQEEQRIENLVKHNIMPEIKALIPGVIGFLLRTIFPKMEVKLIEYIKALFERLLIARENDRATND